MEDMSSSATAETTGIARTPDGAELQWRAQGFGPTVMLVAGQGTSGIGWDHVVPQLAEHLRVVSYDHRGTGQSTMGEATTFSTRDLAADAVTVLDAIEAPTASFYGHSMGGRVGQWIGVDAPERVDRLVLAATTGGDARGVDRPAEITELLRHGSAEALLPLFFGEQFRQDHPEAVKAFFDRPRRISARRAHFEASRRHDAWDVLGRITAPTLVVHGTADQVTPVENGRRLAEGIPHAELFLDEGQLHCPHLESAATQQRVIDFLTQS